MKAIIALFALLTFGLVVSAIAPEAAAQITNVIDDPTDDLVSAQHPDPCNGVVEAGCTCGPSTWFCQHGRHCALHAAFVCVL